MLPAFDSNGHLPPGIHRSSWEEFTIRFGGTAHRRRLLRGLRRALRSLGDAGCREVYIDGSFVTGNKEPGDFDGCWSVYGVDPDRLDPTLLDFGRGREAQKAKFGGELFPAEMPERVSGQRFLDFFQQDREGRPKGIVRLRLRGRKS